MTTTPMTGADFDELYEKVRKAVEESGIEDHRSDTERRTILADRLRSYGYDPLETRVAAFEAAGTPESELVESGQRMLTITEPPTDPYWYDEPRDAAFIDHYIMTRRAWGQRLSGGLLIRGPAGSGKTESVTEAIKRLNERHDLDLHLTKMECPTITDPQKWFGRREIDKDGTRYELSDFIIAVERGDVILLDEVWRLHPHLTNPIMSLIDGSEAVHLSDLNITVNRHPQTVIIGTANEGAQFSGNHRPDWAVRERFPFTIERGFPPTADEIRVLVSRSGCDPDGASRLVAIANKTRDLVEQGDLSSPISTRTLVNAAQAMAWGMTEIEALSVTALPLYDKDSNGMTAGEASEYQKVLHIMQGKLG